MSKEEDIKKTDQQSIEDLKKEIINLKKTIHSLSKEVNSLKEKNNCHWDDYKDFDWDKAVGG